MSRTKIFRGTCLLFTTSAATFVLIRHTALTDLRNENIALREQAVQTLRTENDRLATKTRSPTAVSLSAEEFRELLRLRGEVGSLRSQLAESTSKDLAAEGSSATNRWSHVGAHTPEAALETLLWALSNTNFNCATGLFHFEISGLTSPATIRQVMYSLTEDPGSFIRHDMMTYWITNLQSLEIISAVPADNEDVLLKLWETKFDGNKRKVAARVRRVENEWKFLAKWVVLELNRAGDAVRSRLYLAFSAPGQEWPPAEPPQTSETQSRSSL